MSKMEAFIVQCAIILVVVIFGAVMMTNVTLAAENEKWISRVWDVLLIILSPAAFSAAVYRLLSPTEENKNEKTAEVKPTNPPNPTD